MREIEITSKANPEVFDASDGSISMTIPIQITRRLRRSQIVLPPTASHQAAPLKPPTALQAALVRGYQWLALLESGASPSIRAIAQQEGIDNSYVSRIMNLTTLAPDIIEAILDESLPEHVTLFDLASGTPLLWDEQRGKVFMRATTGAD